jgi:hypothetical protein
MAVLEGRFSEGDRIRAESARDGRLVFVKAEEPAPEPVAAGV